MSPRSEHVASIGLAEVERLLGDWEGRASSTGKMELAKVRAGYL